MIRAFKNIHPLREPDYNGPTPLYCDICGERITDDYVAHGDMTLCMDCQEDMERIDEDFGHGKVCQYQDFAGLDMECVRIFMGVSNG